MIAPKFFKAASLALAGTIAASALPTDADAYDSRRNWDHGRRHNHWDNGRRPHHGHYNPHENYNPHFYSNVPRRHRSPVIVVVPQPTCNVLDTFGNYLIDNFGYPIRVPC